MQIFYNNYITDTSLTASSASEGYDVDNLKVSQLKKDFNFTGNNESVIMSFSNATEIKTFIVDMGNMSSTATITLEGNATNVWTSPSYSQVLSKTDTAAYLLLDETYQYWRITMDDSTVTTITIGYLFIGGDYLQMPQIDPTVELFYNTTSSTTISISGQVYGDRGYEFMDTTFNFPEITEDATTIQGIDVATRKEVLTFFNTVHNNKPFWVFLFSNDLDEHPPLFCILANKSLSMRMSSSKKCFSTTLSLREVK